MSFPPPAPALHEVIEPQGTKLTICPACRTPVENDLFFQCVKCDAYYCGRRNCPATCDCDSLRPLAADLIRNAEPILSQFCVHEKEQDCDRCFLRGKTSVHYMKDESGRFILMNGAVDRFIQPRISRDGCKQSIIGLTLHDLMDEDQAQPLVVQDLKVLQSGKPQEMVQWLPDPSQPGTVRQWFVSKRLMIMSDRRRFIVAVAYDITQFSRRKSDKESLTQIAHCNREHQA